MTHAIVKLSIPFETLVEAVRSLGDEERQALRQILDQPANDAVETSADQSWQALMTFIEESAIDTGIADLAYQHDHYIHGTPKRTLQSE